MAAMNPPQSSAVVDVRKEDVDRYRAAGWTDVKKKATSKKSSSKSDDE